jgi:tRNA-Thr(GGU) m(6)t(6)A37 methyltransferase TsaA
MTAVSIRKAFSIKPIGHIESPLTDRASAPKQGREGSPLAWLVFDNSMREALRDLQVGEDVIVLTWLNRAHREVLRVHPRDDQTRPKLGVFSTRSPDRPNPIGLHRVKIVAIHDVLRIQVKDLEALHLTPILDLKPVLEDGY